MVGPSVEMLRWVLNKVVACTTDMGTELLLAETPDVLPAFLLFLRGEPLSTLACAVDRTTRFSQPTASYSPVHVLRCTRALYKCMRDDFTTTHGSDQNSCTNTMIREWPWPQYVHTLWSFSISMLHDHMLHECIVIRIHARVIIVVKYVWRVLHIHATVARSTLCILHTVQDSGMTSVHACGLDHSICTHCDHSACTQSVMIVYVPTAAMSTHDMIIRYVWIIYYDHDPWGWNVHGTYMHDDHSTSVYYGLSIMVVVHACLVNIGNARDHIACKYNAHTTYK